MEQIGLLLSYFREPGAAQTALRTLDQKGFRRRILLQRTSEGQILKRDPSRRFRNTIILVGGFILSSASVTLSMIGFFPWLLTPTTLNHLVITVIGFGLGAGMGAIISAQLFPVVSRDIIERHTRWLRREESLLILQAPLQSLTSTVQTLRDSIETDISIFALHPLRIFPESPHLRKPTALPLPQIRAHAAQLSKEHHIEDLKGNPSRVLLDQLVKAGKTIHAICSDLIEVARLEQSMSTVAEWILDNEYLIESHGRDVQLNLPKTFYRELPTLTGDPDRNFPRIYSLAKELVAHSDAHLDRENIVAFLSAYQENAYLTIGELWALPLMLRIALIQRVEQLALQAWEEMRDRELADLWANRLLATLRRDPDQLFAVLAELAEERGRPSPYFASQLSGQLYDEEAVLVPVQSWLERSLRRPLAELHSREQSRQAINQISIGNAITSLRQLSFLDWREVFEMQSQVEKILRRDPAGIYPDMDFEARNQYREAVEVLAKGSGIEEIQVARQVVEMAASGEVSEGWISRQRHVGTYLIGEGRRQFSKTVGCRESLRHRFHQWVYRFHTSLYLTSMILVTLGLVAFPALLSTRDGITILDIFAIILLVLPASQLATEAINYLTTRILPASQLPKMDFSQNGIPDEYRTLVVIPMLLVDEATITSEIEKLEIRFLGNRGHNLVFSLFSDFMDADTESTESDSDLLRITKDGISRLNRSYGEGRFYHFHRQRTWSESEQKYIGWERKRGKLEELNRLILGQHLEEEPSIVYVGEANRLTDIRYVITLDSDTQLPRDSARRLVETLAHPLNQPRYDQDGQIAKGSYSLIQPRVSSSLPSAVATIFSRIYTDPVGTDPYTKAVSNAYQDLSGEGSYIGKGIYEPRFFHHMLEGCFPDEYLLSHDLIEGAYVHTGLASDIELFDEFPSDYISYSQRQHRWIRGDWQIFEWILPRVPDRNHNRIANPLSLLNRWKIFDNLRRSLVPAATVAALAVTWFFVGDLQLFATALAASVILFQSLAGPLTWATSRHGMRAFSMRQIRHDLARAIADASLLLHQAGLALDAIVRVFYRRLISRRGLLEWTSAQMNERSANERQHIYQNKFWLISLLSLGLGLSVFLLRPENLLFALPWLILWFLSPIMTALLTRKQLFRKPHEELNGRDVHMVRRVARRTWRYFADFVGEDTSWLPPDNYQVSHQNQLALRTSPTNIGMWMLSAVAANDFGYLTLDQTIDRLTKTMKTLYELERHEGHLLNWYNLEDLSPLKPRYVSSVDSGNFIAALWTIVQSITENLEKPILSTSVLGGLQDTTEILVEELKKENAADETQQGVLELLDLILECPSGAIELIRLVRKIQTKVESIAAMLREDAGIYAGAAYWA
ncbi:MAG: hypothetical protein MUO54_08150, partial [Anaerolineales bacterium]|nr:hypothetical protein [Anaerolineales bacterium]